MPIALVAVQDKTALVPLTKIVALDESPIENAIVAKRPINEEYLAQLLQVDDPNLLPPVEVVVTQDNLILIDGHHRFERAKRKGEDKIKVHMQTYANEYEIIDAAFRSNLKHGLPAGHTTRVAYAIWLYVTPIAGQNISMREAARRAGIDHAVVSREYAKLQDSQEIRETSSSEEETEKRKSMISPVKQLGKALYTYFLKEQSTLTGDIFSPQSENIRVKGLVQYFSKAKDKQQTIMILRSLAKSITTTANTLENL